MANLLIIGNGATGVDGKGKSYVNVHTGKFLKKLALKGYNVTFLQLANHHDHHTNLRGYCLEDHEISSISIQTNLVPLSLSLLRLIWQISSYNFVYIFIPGKLGKIIGSICFILKIKYGIYVRGELFGNKGIDKWIISSAKFILTVSPIIKDRLLLFNNDVEVIKPMTELRSKHKFERKPFEKKPENWSILFVGRLEERKGVQELIEVSRILNDYGVKHKLNLVGGGPLTESLYLQKKHNLLPKNINLAGHIEKYSQLLKIYEQADVFIFLSHDEGFPRTLYEAMIKSLPIFTTFVGGIPGRMKDGINCIEVPLKNPEGVAKIIQNKLSDIETLNLIAKNGLSTILNVLESYKSHDDYLHQKVIDYD